MEELRKEIIEYYSNLINEIDIKCEKAILFFKTEEAVNEIETNRQKIISKIKQTEMIKLENFKDSETLYDGIFAFLISKRSSMDIELLDKSNSIPDEKFPKSWIKSQEKGEKFKFIVHLGQLIVSSYLRQDDFTHSRNGELNIKFHSYILEELTKRQVYAQLIKNKNDQVIIDLSQKEKNQIDSLKLTSNSEDDIPMTESGFELIPTYLDVESVKKLKIFGYKETEFPTQLFRPFKNLTRLKLEYLEFLKSLNENSFIGMESLEILDIARLKIDIEENAFKALINLKLLIFTDCCFGKFHKTSGLENLRELKIKECSFENFRLEYFEFFKNLENLQIIESEFVQSKIKSFNGFEKLKILETDENEKILLKSNLDILSLNFQSFKPHASFNRLKFLNIRVGCPLNQIEHLNQLNQLEFLDLSLPNKLTKKFNQVNLPKLKYLVLTCRNTPNFNESLKNLQGLELIGARSTSRDKFINLISLDYLAITNPGRSMLETFCGTTFSTINNLKFLKIESSQIECGYENFEKNEINEKLSKLFESPENVLFYDELSFSFINDENLFELSAKFGEEHITEKVYFEKYLKVSDCIREFVLNKDSNYYEKYLRNTKRRQSNFVLDKEIDSDIENESDDVDYGGYYGGDYGGYDSDDMISI